MRGRCSPLDRPLCVNRLVFLKLFPLYSNIPVHWCDSAIKSSLFFKYASLLKVFPQLLLDNDSQYLLTRIWPSIKYEKLEFLAQFVHSCTLPVEWTLLCRYLTAVIISSICRCTCHESVAESDVFVPLLEFFRVWSVSHISHRIQTLSMRHKRTDNALSSNVSVLFTSSWFIAPS